MPSKETRVGGRVISTIKLLSKRLFLFPDERDQSSMELLWLEAAAAKSLQSCPTLCNPTDYTVHGILQARILEWVAFPFSRGSFQARGRIQVSRIYRWILYQLSHEGSPRILEWVAFPFSRGSFQPRN